MAYEPRISAPDTVHHAMARGNNGEAIFLDDQDREKFVSLLIEGKKAYGLIIYTFCFMTNHLHMLLKTGSSGITEFMQPLLKTYATWFNRKYGRYGKLFHERFRAPVVADDRYAKEVFRYIAMNPVKAGMVAAPELWAWSGHNAILGIDDHGVVDVDGALELFGSTVGEARDAYLDCVAREDPFSVQRIEDALAKDCRILVEEQREMPDMTLLEILAAVSAQFDLPADGIIGPSRAHAFGVAREALVSGALSCGYRPGEVAAFMKRSPSMISRWISKATSKK